MTITVSSAAVAILLSLSPAEMTDDQFEQAYCMAANNYHEFREAGPIGMNYVSNVVHNISMSSGGSYCDEIMRDGQFSWTNDDMEIDAYDAIEMQAYRDGAVIAVQWVMGDGYYVTDANHYYNPRKANPSWARKMKVVAKYGDHVFLKGN